MDHLQTKKLAKDLKNILFAKTIYFGQEPQAPNQKHMSILHFDKKFVFTSDLLPLFWDLLFSYSRFSLLNLKASCICNVE